MRIGIGAGQIPAAEPHAANRESIRRETWRIPARSRLRGETGRKITFSADADRRYPRWVASASARGIMAAAMGAVWVQINSKGSRLPLVVDADASRWRELLAAALVMPDVRIRSA